MTIRQQVFAYVVPLFVMCGAVGALVSYWLQTGAEEQAFVEDLRSMSAVVSEFVGPSDLSSLAGGQSLRDIRLGAALARIDRWQLIGRVFIVSSKSGAVLCDSLPSDGPLPTARDLRGLEPGETRILPVQVTATGQQRIPVVTLTYGGGGILGMYMPAAAHRKTLVSIRSDSVVVLLVASAIGLVVASVLAAFVAREVHVLGGMVSAVGTPSFPSGRPESLVREASELANSLGIMHNVLEETIESVRNLVPESDRYRSERGLSLELQGELQRTRQFTGAGIVAAWFSAGEPPPAAFAGLVPMGGDRAVAFVGMAGEASTLSSVLRAGAATAYFADALKRHPADRVFSEARALFSLECLAVVEWDGSTLRGLRAGRDGDPEAFGPDAWAAGTTYPLSCLGAVNQGRMELYLARYQGNAPDRSCAELSALLDEMEPGVALLLGRPDLAAKG